MKHAVAKAQQAGPERCREGQGKAPGQQEHRRAARQAVPAQPVRRQADDALGGKGERRIQQEKRRPVRLRRQRPEQCRGADAVHQQMSERAAPKQHQSPPLLLKHNIKFTWPQAGKGRF